MGRAVAPRHGVRLTIQLVLSSEAAARALQEQLDEHGEIEFGLGAVTCRADVEGDDSLAPVTVTLDSVTKRTFPKD